MSTAQTTSRIEEAFRVEEVAALRLAALARVAVLAVVAASLALLESPPALFAYEFVIVVLALSGLLQYALRVRSRWRWTSPVFIAVDAVLLVGALIVLTVRLNPARPASAALSTAPVVYFFLLIASVALLYSPRLTVWAGVLSVLAWGAGVVWVATRPAAGAIDVSTRIEELIALALCAGVLAVGARRSRRLVTRQVQAARERANLARYFSPTVVDELAGRDEPFGPVRRQDVGVLFADIEGFTTMAEATPPEEVMLLLRDFHARMEAEVFRHGGTLEKFIGDALLATFGVPHPGEHDAVATLQCVRAMLAALDDWNTQRASRGETTLNIGIGAHYGPAVLGEIGSERSAAFAVVGDTVNTASRLQALTRELGARAAVSETLVRAAESDGASLRGFEAIGARHVRGRERPITVWVLRAGDGGGADAS
ncbi:MAG: adenylate/guanylate cyclase domain-containing protein [Gemmatimonadetes bacterium]|nr:adenylate/guanylate cyclase domain-containing protein [Gemmatimonadota bacterium]